ncbi:cytochrome P450 [Streptomyces gamaensis]|uniref:Cytochrome P450 n=1 Tax=Streptomyces gamaensis TaxID=1763542 RepID=A0ABW0YWD9_9ACTN
MPSAATSHQPPPTAPGALPLLGHSLRLVRDPLPFVGGLREQGELVRIRVGTRPALVVCHPSLVHEVLVTQAHRFEKGGIIFEHLKPVSGNGLFTVEEPDHLRHRRLMQPAFTKPAIAAYTQIMAEEAHRLSEAVGRAGTADIKAATRPAVARILLRSIFPTMPPERVLHFLRCLDTVFAGVFARIVLPVDFLHELPLPRNVRYQRALEQSWATATSIVAEARAAQRSGAHGAGLLPEFMRAGAGVGTDAGTGAAAGADTDRRAQAGTGAGSNADADTNTNTGTGTGTGTGKNPAPGTGFTDTQLRDQVMSLLLAGSENAATVVALACHHLAHDPRVERLLHAEVDSLPATPDAGLVASLPYTARVATEILRLYPPVWCIDRRAQENFTLAGHRFPAGTDVIVSPYLLHHDPELFPDPEHFLPERWEPGRTSERARAAFIPFGAGNRKCIGDAFGMAEATVLLAVLTRSWRLRPAPGARVRVLARAPLAARGVVMRVEKRTEVPADRGQ